MHVLAFLPAVALFVVALVADAAAQSTFRAEEIERELGVGYAVSLVDVDGDGRLDIVVVDQTRVLWYQNPSWQRRVIIEDQTKPDNVCIAPYDVDGDGQIDFALGADWRPSDTLNSGTIQWLRRGATLDEPWTVFPIGVEPTVHRMRWADFDGDGRAELIVSPLQGRGVRPPTFDQHGVRTLRFPIPADPTDPAAWQAEVINDDLHVTHSLWPADLNDDGRLDLLVASFEGVSLLERSDNQWRRTLVGSGNQETAPNRGASEIKPGRRAGHDGYAYLATIEPWHGFQVVAYTPPAGDSEALWRRQVLDDQLAWGHAVWCANVDADADEELIVGVRDNASDAHRAGVRIYDPRLEGDAVVWRRQLVDPGGVAVEDLAAADLDGDGDNDIVAAGRATKNVKIYWNDGAK